MLCNNLVGTLYKRTLKSKLLPGVLFFSFIFIVSFNSIKNEEGLPATGVTTELHLNEGSGTNASDASGNNHPGTLTGGATWTTGKYGQGVNLNGSNSYINIPDHNDFTLNPAQSYTWSAWVKNNNFNQWSTVWSQTVSTSNFFYFYAHTSNDYEAGPVTNGVTVYWYSSGGNKLVIHSNNNVLSTGQWSHITVTYNGSVAQNSRITIYVNGTDVTNRSDVVSSGAITSLNPTNIRVGSNQPYGEYLNGAVDEVRYYTRLLSSAEILNDMNTGNAPDTDPPSVNITAPASGNISGTVNVTANASDNVGIAGVQFQLDGVNLGTEDITPPYSTSWNTTTATNGTHNLTAIARDAAGNTSTSAAVSVNVNNDITPPEITITAPAAGVVNGTITVNANASDNVGVAGVQFLINGANLGSEDLTNPYSVSWNTTIVPDGSYTLTARARDAAGNIKISDPIVVAVQNVQPDVTDPTVSITSPSGGSVSGTINVTASASDNTGVTGVQFLLNGVNFGSEDLTSPYSISWNTTTVSNGTYTLSARARDAAGNTGTSTDVVVTVDNDATPPTVSITEPSTGTVSGTIIVSATANDNIAVVGVQFLLNGANLGSEDLSSPYTVSWNTNNLANGTYTLTARARDAAGNIKVSDGVLVTIDNDKTAPTVNITSPAAGTIAGTIDLTADAWDNVGVVGVQFLLNGTNLGAEDITAPYSTSWNTATVTDGSYILTARVRDASGNTTTSSSVIVAVKNDVTPPTINITAPSAGNVSGTINVAANASDNIGIVGVQFLLDGNNLGSEDISFPYSVSWLTTGTGNGSHTLTARAKDASGNTAISDPVVITVNNTNTNLVAAYGFNENTGNVANDNSGKGNTGALTNGPTWSASGKFGSAILFDGSNDFVNVNDANSLDLTNGMTLEAWVNPGNLTGYKTIICKDRNSTSYSYTLAANNNSFNVNSQRPNSRLRIGSSNRTVTGTSKLPINTWTHVASTYDGSTIRLYINGVQVSTFTVSGNIATTTNPLRIGGSTALSGQYFAGLIDEVRIYNRALTQAEIQTDMNTPVAPDEISPIVNITAPLGGDVSGVVTITANASDNAGVTGVQFIVDGADFNVEDNTAPYSVSWNTNTVANGSHTLSARAKDAAGNMTTSAGIVINVKNDIEAPVVSVNPPAASPVVGTVDITATADDNVGVAGVQFLLDGNNLETEDIVAPFAVTWNTLTVTNGDHILTAIARDAAGNTTTSDELLVNVANPPDTESPVVMLTAPDPGNVSGTINLTANASDNYGVAGVQFLLDGNNLGTEDITAPYTIGWNTVLSGSGSHILSARARDAAGNTTLAADVNVTVVISNPPVISGISVSSVTANSVVINWTTNVPATSQINYGTTISYGLSTLIDENLTTSHSMILNGLSPATTYHYKVLSANIDGITGMSADNIFTLASMVSSGSLNGHTVFTYPSGQVIPWTPSAEGYSTVVALAWNYLLYTVPNDPSTGKPAYYSRSYLNPNSQAVVDWPHNPAGLYGMLIESALKYYAFSGDDSVMRLAQNIALWHLDHGMTLATDSWPGVPYSSGDAGSLTYDGANKGNSSGEGDGDGYLEPDKIGELANSWLQLYKFSGNVRFRDAAIQAGNVLASKIRVGSVSQSPWPFRVNAHTGAVREEYCGNIIAEISLLDNLIASGLGNTANYQTARTAAWNWLMTYPIQNNIWSQYFEDVGIITPYNYNFNQYDAMMTARYLLEHPEFDPNWQTHVRGLITWVENTFGQAYTGATIIKEQITFPYAMGSHTSRYASVNALLYEKTGDLAAKEKAYRSFNWATYMARSTGVVIDGLLYGSANNANQWFTDGYGDYIRHFITGMGAVPEWSPVNETHLLRSTSVIQNVSYGTNSVSYTTYDGTSTEVLHMNFNPVVVTADGVPLPRRTDLNQPGWVLDVATKTLRVYHTGATQIVISSGEFSREIMTELYTNNNNIILENELPGNVGPVFYNTTGKSKVPGKDDRKYPYEINSSRAVLDFSNEKR